MNNTEAASSLPAKLDGIALTSSLITTGPLYVTPGTSRLATRSSASVMPLSPRPRPVEASVWAIKCARRLERRSTPRRDPRPCLLLTPANHSPGVLSFFVVVFLPCVFALSPVLHPPFMIIMGTWWVTNYLVRL